MSASSIKLITILCLSCTALSGPEHGGVVWRDIGGAITIQCRPPEPEQDFLTLKKGLMEDHVMFKENKSEKETIATGFAGRLQLNGVFPNLDILIKNLTLNDTGPYWCVYRRFDPKSGSTIIKKGQGSVLLVVVVKELHSKWTVIEADTPKQCEPANKDLVLVSVVISAAVLLGIIMGFLIWIIYKTKTLHSTQTPRRVTTNDVYEDMRGTLRR